MAMLTTSTLSRRWPTARRGRSSRPVGKPRVKKMPLRSELLSQSALLLAASMLLQVCSQAQLAPPNERGDFGERGGRRRGGAYGGNRGSRRSDAEKGSSSRRKRS